MVALSKVLVAAVFSIANASPIGWMVASFNNEDNINTTATSINARQLVAPFVNSPSAASTTQNSSNTLHGRYYVLKRWEDWNDADRKELLDQLVPFYDKYVEDWKCPNHMKTFDQWIEAFYGEEFQEDAGEWLTGEYHYRYAIDNLLKIMLEIYGCDDPKKVKEGERIQEYVYNYPFYEDWTLSRQSDTWNLFNAEWEMYTWANFGCVTQMGINYLDAQLRDPMWRVQLEKLQEGGDFLNPVESWIRDIYLHDNFLDEFFQYQWTKPGFMWMCNSVKAGTIGPVWDGLLPT